VMGSVAEEIGITALRNVLYPTMCRTRESSNMAKYGMFCSLSSHNGTAICCLLSRILWKGKVLIEAFAGNRIQVTVSN
jgi:hypothetical protein